MVFEYLQKNTGKSLLCRWRGATGRSNLYRMRLSDSQIARLSSLVRLTSPGGGDYAAALPSRVTGDLVTDPGRRIQL
jgi:hypothetical protein